jgi:hypothetical protein
MDFDDMPDSYFAFLSNQRKLAEPDKINGAMRELGHGAEPEVAKNKVRSRTSQPNLSSGSKPSVPSLPSIQRGSSSPGQAPLAIQPTAGRFSQPPSRSQLGAKPPTGPGSRPGYPVHPSAQMNAQSHPNPGHAGHGHPGHASQPGHPGHVNAQHHSSASGPISHGSQSGANQLGHASAPHAMSNNGYGYAGPSMGSPVAAPSRSNALVFALIAILVAAIGVLAYLVLTK